MRNRPGITHVPKGTTEDDKDRCVEDDHALVIWHENYPFGKFITDLPLTSYILGKISSLIRVYTFFIPSIGCMTA